MKIDILKTIVGSKAHGLAKPDSDTDYRGVHLLPTSEILSLGFNYKGSSWIEGDIDQTSYELGHFLMLALKNNPSILEVFKAPIVSGNADGEALRHLFKYVYDPKQAFNAFTGYSINQRKKMLDDREHRRNKFATAYIRTLYNLNDLLETGTFSLEVTDKNKLVILKQLKYQEFHNGFVIDLADELTENAKKLLDKAENKSYNPSIVNEFLIDVRKRNW